MKICLCTDNTLPLPIEQIVVALNQICNKAQFIVGKEHFRIESQFIAYPNTHNKLLEDFKKELESFDYVLLFTNIAYEDNFFFYAKGNLCLVSGYGWNLLTDLPLTNGLFYFIAEILTDNLGIGERHESNIGCINDFLWDKTGIDIGMRSAFICRECLETIKQSDTYDPELLQDVETILDLLSRASRSNRDILSMPFGQSKPADHLFDLFLCHNSNDKPELRTINQALREASIKTWLDEDQLPLGISWQAELEKNIPAIRNAAVFVGESGLGPWQNFEVRAFLSEFVNRGCPVIPVILKSAKSVPELPIFLKQMTWLDFRSDYDKKLRKLIGAINRF